MRTSRTKIGIFTLSLAAAALAVPPALASYGGSATEPQADELEGEQLEALIESLANLIEERYIFADVAQEIGQTLRQHLWDGDYEGITRQSLAVRLTRDLRSVNNDLHLGARPIPPERRRQEETDPEEARRQRLDAARRSNYGFARTEILDGNIGYLDLRSFAPTSLGGDTAVAAMGFLANVDALIIDLRRNGGGSPSMIQLLSSYFFEESTHLNSFEMRGQEQIDQFWTLPHVPGKKLVDVPLFILTSSSTFSAAEEFTYNMKNLGRATIIGQTTGGGAHPGGTHNVEGLISVFVPDGRAINPITGTNWEGTGIEPHVSVKGPGALDEGQRLAREALVGE